MKKKRLISRRLSFMLWKTKLSHIRLVLEQIKLLRTCVLGILLMVVPHNDKQHEQMKMYINTYDKLIKSFETDIVSRARKFYINDED